MIPTTLAFSSVSRVRNTRPWPQEFRQAWKTLRQKIVEPFSVVFDIGGFARDNEHIHSACVRQVQKRLGYCGQGNGGQATKGHIGLQDYGGAIEFRNIKIRPLAATGK